MLLEILMRLFLAGCSISTFMFALAIWIGAHVFDFTAKL